MRDPAGLTWIAENLGKVAADGALRDAASGSSRDGHERAQIIHKMLGPLTDRITRFVEAAESPAELANRK
jgi:hypothetical protein